jgi:hypothetical protein
MLLNLNRVILVYQTGTNHKPFDNLKDDKNNDN